MEQSATLLGKATFAMDRGYDENKMFLKLNKLGQDYVIRLKSKNGPWLRNFVIDEKAKSKPMFFIKGKTMKLTSPM